MQPRLWFAALATLLLVFLAPTADAAPRYDVAEQQSLRADYGAQGMVVDFDAERGLPRRVLNTRFTLDTPDFANSSPEAASAQFLRENALLLFGTEDVAIDALGRGNSAFELVVTKVRPSLSGTQVFRQQFSNGLPIDGAVIQVNMDANGKIMSAINTVVPSAVILDPVAQIAEADAVQAVLDNTDRSGRMRADPHVELVGWYNGGRTHLAYLTEVALWSPYSDQVAYVDAKSGEVLTQRDVMIHCNHKRPGEPVGRLDIAPPPEVPEPESFLARRVAGSGNVLPSNPLDGRPDLYGLRDGDPVFGEVENVILERLDGSGFLRGEYVDATNSSIARASEPSLVFDYSPDVTDGNFHEVNVYWHLDQFQNYIQTDLGILNANNRMTEAAAHEGEDDNSSYSPTTLRIRFGDGGVDDSEDGEVVIHEYGHAIHDDISGIGGDEARAISEGFSDYMAATFSQNPIIAEWDATSYNPGPPPFLRRTDGTKTYPDDLVGQVHSDGEIISAAWWELNTILGPTIADRLTLESFFLVGASINMPEMADAYVQADQAIYGGAHLGTIFSVFGNRGMGPAYLLEIDHDALTDTEDTAGPYDVLASVLHTSPITGTDAVQMFWRIAGDPTFTAVTMAELGSDQYAAQIPGPGGDATIEYYLSVEDDQAVTNSLPAGAPASVFTFNVGTDTVAPTLTHTALGDQPLLVWPAEVRATATDNLGLDSVEVSYSLNGAPQGSFPLFFAGGDDFAADFPIPAVDLVFGDVIEYSITATDGSSAANTTSVGPYSFEIIDAKGVVLIVDDDADAASGGTKLDMEKVEHTDVPRDPAKVGAAATQMEAVLTAAGYVVTVESAAATDPGTWSSYNVVISSSGANTSPMADPAYRAALVAYAQSGGKLFVEGGEVGYDAASTPGYADIVADVIHADDWNSDNAGALIENAAQVSHPIRTMPNALPASIDIDYSSFGDEDAVTPLADSYIVYGTTSYPDDAGVLVYDDNPAPQSAQIVFCAFAMDAVADPAVADALVENIVEFLLAEETGANASLSGRVTLGDGGAAEGLNVSIGSESTTTDANGNYSFADLFAATYLVSVEAPEGYADAAQTIVVGEGQDVTGVNFELQSVISTDVVCNAAAVPIPDNDPAGITSEIFVADAGEIITATMSVDITHTWRNDLIVSLTSPGGTEVVLQNRSGGSADDLIVTFADIGDFQGEASQGVWTLYVSDNAGADTGTLNEWCINFDLIEEGAVSSLVSYFGARTIEQGVEVSWELNGNDGIEGVRVVRQVDGDVRVLNDSPLAAEIGTAQVVDPARDLREGDDVRYVLEAVYPDGDTTIIGDASIVFERIAPSRMALSQNAPNPFNPSTKISFALPQAGRTTLRIYDLAGRLVNELVSEELTAGHHEIVWNGTDSQGQGVASGSYLYRLKSGSTVLTKRMILLK